MLRCGSQVHVCVTSETEEAHEATRTGEAVAWLDHTAETKSMNMQGNGIRGKVHRETWLLLEAASLIFCNEKRKNFAQFRPGNLWSILSSGCH